MNTFGFYIEKSNDVVDWRPSINRFPYLLETHGFIVIRGFDVSDSDHLTIANSLGSPIRYGFGQFLNMTPKENTQESQFTNKSMALHQDTILNDSEKAHYLVFKCKEAPSVGRGGETLLTNNTKFLEIIPDTIKQRLITSTIEYLSESKDYYVGKADRRKPVLQKPIIKNAYSGKESLFIGIDDPADDNRNYVSFFSGVNTQVSAIWMKEIDSFLRDPRVLYTHQWNKGDILICDNFLTCHGRNSFLLGEKRHLVRISVA